MRKILMIFIPAMCLSKLSCAQLPDSMKVYIDSAFIILQHSLYSNRVNWETEKTAAYEAAGTITSKADLLPVITAVYKKLDDHHGWFQQYGDRIQLPWKDKREPTGAMRKAWANGPKVAAMMLGDIAYLRIPNMNVYTQAQIDYYANWLADSVRSLAAKNPKAWIIDLRVNGGGNIIPMMSGLASFFPEGILSHYLDKNNKAVSASAIRNKIFMHEDSLHANLKQALPKLDKQKVAILIGRGTGSSGEGVAYNFMNRKRTRSFGEASAGVANSTEGFLFNEEQSYFLLTTAKLGNRHKKPAPETLLPQVIVPVNDNFETPANDATVKAALKWLK